jgi:hypothetical protein
VTLAPLVGAVLFAELSRDESEVRDEGDASLIASPTQDGAVVGFLARL